MKKAVIFATLSFGAALAMFAFGSKEQPVATASFQQAAEVSIGDNFYTPQALTVVQGTTLVWTNNGGSNHTVTSDTGVFDSGIDPANFIHSGQQYSFTFTTPGTYPYFCYLHGAAGGVGQSGTITVVAQPTVQPTPTPNTSTAPTSTATPAPGQTTAPVPTPRPSAGPVSGVAGPTGDDSNVLPWAFVSVGVVVLCAGVVVSRGKVAR